MICLTVFALNRHSVFWMPLLYESSLSGSVAVCREKRAWQLWPEVVVDFTISDKKPSARWEHSTLLWWNKDSAAACCNKKHSQMFPLSTYFIKCNQLNRQCQQVPGLSLFFICLWFAGEGHQPDAHWVSSVTHEPRPVRVLHQRRLNLLPGPGRGHRRPAYTDQRPRARAVTQQREGHRLESVCVVERGMTLDRINVDQQHDETITMCRSRCCERMSVFPDRRSVEVL